MPKSFSNFRGVSNSKVAKEHIELIATASEELVRGLLSVSKGKV